MGSINKRDMHYRGEEKKTKKEKNGMNDLRVYVYICTKYMTK